MENRITGPGYYPKRPGIKRPVVRGKPSTVRIFTTAESQWDSRYWDTGYDKPTLFEIPLNRYVSSIGAIKVYDIHEQLLYTQVVNPPVVLRDLHSQHLPFKFTIDVDWRP